MNEPELLRCAKHRNQTTQLRCGRCGDPICVRCLSHAPGGMRCPNCAGREASAPRKQTKPIAFIMPLSVLIALVLISMPSVRTEALALLDRAGTSPDGGGGALPFPARSASPFGDRPAETEDWERYRLGSQTELPGWGTVALLWFDVAVRADDRSERPRAGWMFAIGDFELCVTEPGKSGHVTPELFHIRLQDNARIIARDGIRSPQLPSTTIFTGECVRGYVAFEIPLQVPIASINFQIAENLGVVHQMAWRFE